MLVIFNKSAKNALFSLRVPIKFTVKALEVELIHPLQLLYNYYPMVSFLYQHTNKTFHFVSGSKDVINWMNRYGHTISSDEVNLVETNTAETQASILSRAFVPRIMQSSTFVTFVFDNCDHNLESKFNLTMHCTNGIMIQKCQNIDNRILTHNPILQQAESRK